MKIEDVFMRAHIGASIGFTPPDSQTTRERHAAPSAHHEVCVQQIRSATVKVSYGETTFLVDPMLAPAKAYPGFKLTYRNHLSWPFCDLPVSTFDILRDVDAVILTHLHLDHFDDYAAELLPKDMLVVVQDASDQAQVQSFGFSNVQVMPDSMQVKGVTLTRTACQHGTDAMYADPTFSKICGEVMGIVFQAAGFKSTYLVADTIWTADVAACLEKFQPEVVILNTGHAAVTAPAVADNPYIIMGTDDVKRVHAALPQASIVCVHMDAVNHMTLSRKELNAWVRENKLTGQVIVPFDGEQMFF